MCKKYKIAYLIESYMGGGAENLILNMCETIQSENFCPIVITIEEGWLSEKLGEIGIETIIIPHKKSYDFKFLLKLKKTIIEKEVDIMHSNEFMMNVYGTAISFWTKIPIIACIHGKNYYCEKLIRKIAYRVALNLANNIVVVSKNLKEFIKDKLNISPLKITVIYNGVEHRKFMNIEQRKSEELKRELGLNGYIIGSVGNLYPVKGHLYLIRAARRIIDEYPDVSFIIIGKFTDYKYELEKEIRNLDLQGKVKIFNFRDDIPYILNIIDIFVLSSLEETFSIATVEAMLSAKPVVATQCGGPEELIKNNENGFLVKPRDHQELAQKILFLIKNKQIAQKMANSSREYALNHFTKDRMIKEYKKLYMNIISK